MSGAASSSVQAEPSGDATEPRPRRMSSKEATGLLARLMGSSKEDELTEEDMMTLEELQLNARELHFDERIRTTCLVIMATAVIFGAMYLLEAIAIPFILALALKYLLTPLIDTLSCSGPAWKKCFCRMPRGIAVLLSFVLTISILVALGMVIGQSVDIFTERAPLYRQRLEAILQLSFEAIESAQAYIANQTEEIIEHPSGGGTDHDSDDRFNKNLEQLKQAALDFLKELSLTNLIISLLSQLAHVAENLMYIVLFLVFMLTHSEHAEDADVLKTKVDRQIFVYIRGKTLISLFVACTNGTILKLVGLDLALAFGVLAFFLNFIPNIGMFCSVVLPMPLVALDPRFSTLQVALAFVGPLTVGMFAKDVLEPTILGHSTSLHPVSVLLAIMLFGSVWGLTGMIMAVPLTAVLRIHLEAIDHPLPRYAASVLAGKKHATPAPKPTPREML